MVIVYLSLVLIAAAIIFFVISMMKTAHLMNGSLAKISKTGAKLQDQSAKVVKESEALTVNLSRIQSDIMQKKGKVQDTVNQAKQSILSVQVAVCKGKSIYHTIRASRVQR